MSSSTPTASATSSPHSLTKYKALSFDVFGTLLDWETGLYAFLTPIISQLPADHPCAAPFHPSIPSTSSTSASRPPPGPRHPIFTLWDAHEHRLEAELPATSHDQILAYTFRDLATQLNVAVSPSAISSAASSVPSWPAFADTVSAMSRLSRHYKLVALSNVSNGAIADVLSHGLAGVKFDAVYTAEDIGSYKPAMQNFEYLLDKLAEGEGEGWGIRREEVLHVAHGVVTDQLPAEGCGIDHVWVERGVDNWGEVSRQRMRRFWGGVSDLGVLADLVERAFAAENGDGTGA